MERMRQLRKQKGLSGERLGQMVGVQKSAISKYELGQAQPSQEVLVQIADILNTSTDYLLGRSDDPSIPSAKKSPATMDEAEALHQYLLRKLGREPTLEEINNLYKFAEIYVKSLDK